MANDAWFYSKNEQQLGPVTMQQLSALVSQQQLLPTDLVWTEGLTDWTAAGKITTLFSQSTGIHAAPPPGTTVSPGVMSPINYYSPANQQVFYAGFWLRFCAAFTDGLITGFAGLIIGGCIGGILGGMMAVRTPGARFQMSPEATLLIRLIGICIAWLYEALMESSSTQATLGKMALGLKVTDEFGNRISFGRATGRYFGKWISGIILLIGYFMAGWTEKKQALHDMMAGTLVVRKSP